MTEREVQIIKWGVETVPKNKRITGYLCGTCHEPIYLLSGIKDASGVVVAQDIHASGTRCKPGVIEAIVE